MNPINPRTLRLIEMKDKLNKLRGMKPKIDLKKRSNRQLLEDLAMGIGYRFYYDLSKSDDRALKDTCSIIRKELRKRGFKKSDVDEAIEFLLIGDK